MLRVWTVILLCVNAAYQLNHELPKFIKQCKNNANISKCVGQVLEDLRPHLLKGIPEFSVPPIDPLHVPSLEFARRNSNIADYSANVTSLRWTGCKSFQIVDVLMSLDKPVFRLKLAFPNLTIDAEGYLDGWLLGFQVHGHGSGRINYTDVIFDIILDGELYVSERKEFIRWNIEDIDVTFGDAYYVDLFGFFEDPTVTYLFKLAVNKGAHLMSSTFRKIASSVVDFIINAINHVHYLYPKSVLYAL